MTIARSRPAPEKIATRFLRLEGLIPHLDVGLLSGYNARGAERFQAVTGYRLPVTVPKMVVSTGNREPATGYNAANCSFGYARGSTFGCAAAMRPFSSIR